MKHAIKFLFLILLISSCTHKNDELSSDVMVKSESTIDLGKDKVETLYEFKENECRIVWQIIRVNKDSGIDVQLKNRSTCNLLFSQSKNLHRKVIERILKDYPVSTIKTISTDGLRSLQPDGSWNLLMAQSAKTSKEYKEYRQKYPTHPTQKSINGIFVDILIAAQPHLPFKNMLHEMNLKFEVYEVEKVFSQEYDGEKVIDDAGAFWWRPI